MCRLESDTCCVFSRTYTRGVYYPSYYSFSSSSRPHLSVVRTQSTNCGRSPCSYTLSPPDDSSKSRSSSPSTWQVCVCVCVCACRWVAREQISSLPSGREAIDPSIATRREVLFTTHTEILRENSPQCHTMVVKFSRMETS